MVTRKLYPPLTGSYRISLPKAFVETLELEPGDRIKVDLRDKTIILTPVAADHQA